jgi:uncharacterized damage-inducible protein DinB
MIKEQAKQMMNQWLKHRLVLEELLKWIPDEHINYKPWNGAMALGDLAQHVAGSTDMFVTIAKTGKGKIGFPPIAKCDTMAEVLDIVHSLTEKTKAIYASLTDEELEIEYDSPHPNLKGPRFKLVAIANDHEIHHKGQLFTYARMVGIQKLPFFI